MPFSDSEIEAYRRNNARQCSVFSPGGFRPMGNPAATRFGGVPLGRAGETWPQHQRQYFEGHTQKSGEWLHSSALCQINLEEAPSVPEALKGIALITIFCATHAPDRHGSGGGPQPYAECVTVRAYESLDGLVPLTPPDEVRLDWIRSMECRWEEATDWPLWSDACCWYPDGKDMDDDTDDQLLVFGNRYVSKLGGYHSYSQEPRFDERERFVLQIADEPKIGLGWIDGGTLALGVSLKDDGRLNWHADIQFY